MPLSPVIGNVTVGTTWINLTWYHNESCCTNGKYMLLWQQWQSEETSGNMNGSRMVDPADHHLNITSLNPGTMYMVTVSVECQKHGLQNATVSINATTSKCIHVLHVMHALKYIHVQDCINMHVYILRIICIRNLSRCI